MRWCIPAGEKPLFGPERGCNPFAQRLLSLDATSTSSSELEDEVVFVLAGQGTLAVGGEEHRLEPGAAVYVAREVPWTVHNPDGLEAICVRVSDPEPGVTHAFVPPDFVNTSTATAGRSFVMLCSPAVGCNSVTQFIGLIPPGRAPDHFHRYDEVIYVLDGEGVLEIDDEQAPITTGTCIYLPRGLVHCLANTGGDELRLLGVFTPAGSPAAAYYPDGTLAALPERN